MRLFVGPAFSFLFSKSVFGICVMVYPRFPSIVIRALLSNNIPLERGLLALSLRGSGEARNR